ncbi:MAG: SirB1 family protein [Burkholderiaceae bacterium]
MGSWTPQPTTPLAYFASLVAQDDHIPLLEASACIAQDEYPELDVQQVLGDLDQLLARLKRRLAEDAGPMQRLRLLNQFFFGELGFAGNINDYYSPDNSYLNAVLRTRRGSPISLAVLWLELAQGLRLRASGVSFPGHFLVKVQMPAGQVVLDPFTGESLSREQLLERLEPLQPRGMAGLDADIPLGLYLQAAPDRDILARMLRNLKEIHARQRDPERLIAVLDRLVVLLPEAWGERRDRGMAWANAGDAQRALADLQAYLDHATDASDAALVAERIESLRRELS